MTDQAEQRRPAKRSGRKRIPAEERAFYVNIGQWIKTNRRALKLKQKEIGLALGISKQSVVTWEKGTMRITAHHLAQLIVIFEKMPPFDAALRQAADSTEF